MVHPWYIENTSDRHRVLAGEPMFVATDVAKVLGYRNAPDMTRQLDQDEKVKRTGFCSASYMGVSSAARY